eukprot:GFUD01136909.1.p1 GENE.GFUD01136909.1~~GFUD01136909.1.p1  ORF type:complete len:121 (-),score=17.92 GFUD01136909.1:104-466(-)
MTPSPLPTVQTLLYAEAVDGVQLSPRQLVMGTRQEMTQVMIDQQWSNLQNNTANTDQERLIVPALGKNNCTRWPIILAIVIIKIIVIIGMQGKFLAPKGALYSRKSLAHRLARWLTLSKI